MDKQTGLKQIILVFIVVLAAGSVTFVARRQDDHLSDLREEKERLAREYEELQDKLDELKVRRERLQGDPYLIKQLARQKLGLVPPGEKRIWREESDNQFSPLQTADTVPTDGFGADGSNSPIIRD